jgi:hypothetical protein
VIFLLAKTSWLLEVPVASEGFVKATGLGK